MLLFEQRGVGHQNLGARRIAHVLGRGAAENAACQRGDHRAGVDDGAHLDAAGRTAVIIGDDAVLRHVDETTRQIARVGGLQRGVGETLTRAVRRVEVLEHRQPFLEVRDDRALDDFAGRLRHQAAHAGKLTHLRGRTARAGMRHHVDRVDLSLLALVGRRPGGGDLLHHRFGDFFGALRPGVDHLVVLLALRDQAVIVLLLELLHEVARPLDARLLGARHHHVVLAEGNAGLEGVMEAQRHDAIAEDHRLLLTAVAIDIVDHAGDFALRHKLVDEVERRLGELRQHRAENDPARRRVVPARDRLAVRADALPAVFDPRMQADGLLVQRKLDLRQVAEKLQLLAFHRVANDRKIVKAEHDILRRHDDRRAVRGMQDVVGRHHQDARFELRLERQRHVNRHLVAVEVGIERRADQGMQLNRLALDQHRLEGLDAEAVQRRRAVEQDRMLANDLVENIPNLGLLLLDELLRLLHGGRQTLGVEPRIDERLEQFERHLLRQPALMQLELGADHDHRAAGIIDALAEQVLAEPALLALEHVGERLQRTLVGAGDDAAAAAVVEQGIDRFLQHPLLVADDDVGSAQLDQPLQPVVAVDDAAIEVVEVGRREAAAVERHQRPQVGRDHRHVGQDHPFRLVAGLGEGLDQLEPLGELLRLELGGRFDDLLAQIGRHLLEIERFEHFADRFRADHGGEAVGAELVLRLDVFVFGQELAVLERGEARLEHDVIFEIENALEILQRHVEQKADPARQRLQEPDMRDRRCELDMAHALAAHARQRHFHRALFADDALVLHPLVLAAQALVVLDRPENARAEQAVALGLEGAVVDGLRLFDLAVGPGQNLIRARNRDPDLVEDLSRHLRAEQIHKFLVHRLLRLPTVSAAVSLSMPSPR